MGRGAVGVETGGTLKFGGGRRSTTGTGPYLVVRKRGAY